VNYLASKWRSKVLRREKMKIKRECATCGIDDDVLHKHHVRDEKGVPIGTVLLCANCHNKVHRSGGTIEVYNKLKEATFFAHIVGDMNYEENEKDIEKLELLHEILENYPSPVKIDNPNAFLWLKLNIGAEMSLLKNRKENAEGGGTLLHPY